MKKKILFSLLLIMILTTTTLTATNLANYLPAGKNYLDETNFTLSQDTLSSVDGIKIKSNTTYTLSFPGDGMLEFAELSLSTNARIIYDDAVESISTCDLSMSYVECTFTTNADDTYLDISITADGMSSYISYYEMYLFQLEEGSSRTEFEDYIVPLIDANSPQFNGAGAFVTSYSNNYSLSYIIDSHIVVIDDIDGDITDQIIIVSDNYTPNMNTVGTYIVELKATDAAGNTAYFTLTIIVKDEISPVIDGPASITVGFDTTLTTIALINDNYFVTDGHDTDITISIVEDNYSANKTVVGSYTVKLKATDSSNNETTKTITINVVDQNAPTLHSDTYIYVFQSSNESLSGLISQIAITDDYDAENEIQKTIESETFSLSGNQPGVYSLILRATDSSNNTSTFTFTIEIRDDIYPTISGPSTFVFSYTTPKTLEEILSSFIVDDNYSDLTLEDLVVTGDTYSIRTTKVGTYYIDLKISDETNNTTTKQVQIDVIDDQVPIIYIDNVLITVSSNATFTKQDALNLLVKNKELPDQSYNISVINDEYTGNETKPGRYAYSLRFDDLEGNSLQKDFIIEVPDEANNLMNDTIIRSIIVYSLSIGILAFALLKKKK